MLNEIQKDIFKSLIEKGEISNKELQQKLNIGPSSLYYNLEVITGLCVTRKRGGLELSSQLIRETKSVFHEKLQVDQLEKEEIAESIVTGKYIKHGDTTLLDCGTTNYFIGEKIIENKVKGLNLIVVNPYILKRFLEYPDVGHVSFVGGILNWSDGSLFGPLAINSLKVWSEIGTIILGIDAVDDNGELGINNPLELEQKKVMIEKAKRIIIPLTQSKIGRAVSYSIGNINEFKNVKDILIFLPGRSSETTTGTNNLINIVGRNNLIFSAEPIIT